MYNLKPKILNITLITLIALLSMSCHEYSEENQKDFLYSSFVHSTNQVWKLIDSTYKEIPLDSLVLSKDYNAKILKTDITVYDKTNKELSNDTVLLWYGANDQGTGGTPFFEAPKNLVNIINFIPKTKSYFIYPPQDKPYSVWSLPTEPFVDKFVNIKKEDFIRVIKKESYLINRTNSFIEDKYATQYGIWGNIYDILKFSRKVRIFRIYIEAISETNPTDIIRLDSKEKAVVIR